MINTLSLEWPRKEGDPPKITYDQMEKLSGSTMEIISPEGEKMGAMRIHKVTRFETPNREQLVMIGDLAMRPRRHSDPKDAPHG